MQDARHEGPMNHLANALSPYLRQHARNPVDWYPWGKEALAKAKREQKPIFLSIGYSACHWCHVMERESFENEEIAELLNQNFVSIKVDREERPDLDRVYMKAVQMMTGRGGWPMSVFLTPDLEPFFGGTYFPPDDKHGLPGFRRVVTELGRLWKEERERVLDGSKQIMGRLSEEAVPAKQVLDRAPIELAVAGLKRQFDTDAGGFSRAPKFPPAGSLELLLREHARTGEAGLLKMVVKTLDEMGRGGIYDHLAGGFHRYTVDDQWLVPHFEKMLYDNALLTRVYLDGWAVTREPRFRQVAMETLDFILREMTDRAGGFHSTFDADSEGEEGKYYVWSQAEIERILPETEAKLFAQAYGVTPGGNFEGHNILNLPHPLADVAKRHSLTVDQLEQRLAASRRLLLPVRAKRVPPHKDDKVLTAWNGLMISALARGYQVLGDERYKLAAERAAGFLLDTMHTPEGLLRVFRDGKKSTPGFLDDYAYLGDALLDLFEATGNWRWFTAAQKLATEMAAAFGDPEGNGFFYSRAGDDELIVRERCFLDEARPSPNGVAAHLLLRLARFREDEALERQAEQALAAAAAFGQRFPTALTHTWCTLDEFLAPPEELVMASETDSKELQDMLRAVGQAYRPNLAVVLSRGDHAKSIARIPWLADREARDGKATAYLCVNRVCSLPITTAAKLRKLLD
ncbi:MAG: thioredoxin domain-containing protein [Victivallales bacterium]|nr:thioredoxin domain-containing protein [Victivallales bacterium]